MSCFINELNDLEGKKEIIENKLNKLEAVIDKVKKLNELGLTDTKIPITEDKVSTINKVLKIIYNNDSNISWEKQEIIVYEPDYFTTTIIKTTYKIEPNLSLDIHISDFIAVDIKNAFSKVVDI